ncbi:TPA: GPO family capsid scaffolding protein [Klebsiella michiganensis]|nr:GPO family capsid scaffolding protein [Klebsiella michiganensis]
MPEKVVTDWLCICTAGIAADGRPVEEQWLIDAAETYSQQVYTALIWPWHDYGSGEREFYVNNLGLVQELKCEQTDVGLGLFARFVPNQFLIDYNRSGQKLFTSAELQHDFQGTGRTYLTGVAATDIPASVGTSRIELTADAGRGVIRTDPVTLTMGDLSKPCSKSFLSRLFNSGRSKTFTKTPEPETKADSNKGENMDELKEMISQLLAKFNETQAAATQDDAEEVAAAAEEVVDLADEVAELAEEVAAAPEEEIEAVKEELAARRTELAAAMEHYSALLSGGGKARKPARRQSFSRQTGRRSERARDRKLEKLTAAVTSLTELAAKGASQTPTGIPPGSKKEDAPKLV